MASVLYAHASAGADHDAAYSPESNGLAEGFVHTFERDTWNIHELPEAESVLGLGRTPGKCGDVIHAPMTSPIDDRQDRGPPT